MEDGGPTTQVPAAKIAAPLRLCDGAQYIASARRALRGTVVHACGLPRAGSTFPLDLQLAQQMQPAVVRFVRLLIVFSTEAARVSDLFPTARPRRADLTRSELHG
jgi:hypothetical protein